MCVIYYDYFNIIIISEATFSPSALKCPKAFPFQKMKDTFAVKI